MSKSKYLPWLKLYTDVLNDPKVLRLAPELKWPWVEMLLATQWGDTGTLPPMDDLIHLLRRPAASILKDQNALVAAGLLDRARDGTITPHNWDGRQGRTIDRKHAARQQRYMDKLRGKASPTDVTEASLTSVTDIVSKIVTDTNDTVVTDGTEREEEGESEGEKDVLETQNRGEDCAPDGRAASLPTDLPELTRVPAKRPRRLSKDWQPTERNIEQMVKWGLAKEYHAALIEDFKAWAASSPNAVKLDWDLTLGTFVRRVVMEGKYLPRGRPTSGGTAPYTPSTRVNHEYPASFSDMTFQQRIATHWLTHPQDWPPEYGKPPDQDGTWIDIKIRRMLNIGAKRPTASLNFPGANGNGHTEHFDPTNVAQVQVTDEDETPMRPQ